MANKSMLGIGNALVDILTQIPEDSILQTLNLPKGTMQHVDAETSQAVGVQLKTYGSAMATGGSSANTMSGAAKLGVKCGYIGKVGQDLLGEFFIVTESLAVALYLELTDTFKFRQDRSGSLQNIGRKSCKSCNFNTVAV